ncbi:hypothetical protein [Actinomadura sp. NPDC048394]|uniref:hypothetical protein n=1 Tax=Actinomadura sp. NPDC048394 TaxID=3158223 RepID=UPI0033EBE355
MPARLAKIGRTHHTRALVATALEQVIPLAVPSTALTLAWAQAPPVGRQTLATLVEQRITLSFATTYPPPASSASSSNAPLARPIWSPLTSP